MGRILRKSRSPNKNVAVLEALKKYLFDIYEGEVTDITCRQNLDTAVEDYIKTIWKLTSDGEVCARIGAILGGGSNKEINALAEFGRRLSFIIHLEEEVRDSLNEEGSLPHRMEFESVPLPILYAAKSSSASFFEVKSIIQKEPFAPYVFDLTKICWKTKAITYVHNLAKQNAIEAAKRLESIKPSVARNALFQMIKAPLDYLENAHLEEVRYTEALTS